MSDPRRATSRAGIAILASAVLLLSGGCGVAEVPATAAGAPNVVPLTAKTPRHGFNRLVVSVTLCAPQTNRCTTIDDVMVDTGSTGLRLDASVIPPWLGLPAFDGPDGRPLGQCLRFLHDTAWGPLRRADLRLGGLLAADLPIQIMDDEAFPNPPECPRSAVRPTSNGTLGIGPELTDCRGACRQDVARPSVFGCDAAGCMPLGGSVPPAYRLPNPVSRLPRYDNGIVIALPPSPPEGAVAIDGTLTFGVGTSANNQLGSAAIVKLDRSGRFTTLYGGATLPTSYIDSGTPTYVVPDTTLPRCERNPWALCGGPDLALSASIGGVEGQQLTVPFRVGSYDAFAARALGASDAVATAAEPSSTAFVWGAPFFFGKRIFVVTDGSAVPGRPALQGPFYAVDMTTGGR